MKVDLTRREWERIAISLAFEGEGLSDWRSVGYLFRLSQEILDQLSEYRPRKRK